MDKLYFPNIDADYKVTDWIYGGGDGYSCLTADEINAFASEIGASGWIEQFHEASKYEIAFFGVYSELNHFDRYWAKQKV